MGIITAERKNVPQWSSEIGLLANDPDQKAFKKRALLTDAISNIGDLNF